MRYLWKGPGWLVTGISTPKFIKPEEEFDDLLIPLAERLVKKRKAIRLEEVVIEKPVEEVLVQESVEEVPILPIVKAKTEPPKPAKKKKKVRTKKKKGDEK